MKATPCYLRDHIKDEHEIVVLTKNLGNFIAELDQQIDLIWLDVEGYEYYILETIGHVVDKINAIYVEVNFCVFREQHKTYEQITDLLRSYGFCEYWHESQGSANFGEWQGNVLYVKKDSPIVTCQTSDVDEKSSIKTNDVVEIEGLLPNLILQ